MKTNKVKHLKLSTEKNKANTIFSRYIRTRDANKCDGINLICITCQRSYPAFGTKEINGAQAGHFIQGRHSAVLYDERNAHGQCYNCNINLKGNFLKYYRRMEDLYGESVIAELEYLDTTDPHYKAIDYVDIQEKFKKKLEELK